MPGHSRKMASNQRPITVRLAVRSQRMESLIAVIKRVFSDSYITLILALAVPFDIP